MHLTNYSVNKFSKDVPEILPFPSLEIRDADSVPGMWARVEGTPGAATLHEGEVFASPRRRPSAHVAPPARGPVFAMAGDDRLFTHGASLDHTPLTPAGRECQAAAAREGGEGGVKPEAQSRGPFPRMDPFEHLRRDPVLNETTGLKWSLSALMAVLRREYGIDTPALWRDIRNVISKTLLAIGPLLAHQYASATASASALSGQGLAEGSLKRKGNKGGGAPQREGGFMCYEVLGFDILLDTDLEWSVPRYGCSDRHQAAYTKSVQGASDDSPPAVDAGDSACGGSGDIYTEGSEAGGRRIRPLLLEVNQSPSFGTDARIDEVVKQLALGDALRLAAPDPIWLRKWYKRLRRWRERLAASRPGSPSGAAGLAGDTRGGRHSDTGVDSDEGVGGDDDRDAEGGGNQEEEEEEEVEEEEDDGGGASPHEQVGGGSPDDQLGDALPEPTDSNPASTYSTPAVSPRDLPPVQLGTVSQAVLKAKLQGGAQSASATGSLGALSGRAATEALRWAYEDFVCAAGGYQRLLPSPNPATQAYHAHLLQLVESASGLAGNSRATEARRVDALAKREALKVQQDKRHAMRSGRKLKSAATKGNEGGAAPASGGRLAQGASSMLEAAAALATDSAPEERRLGGPTERLPTREQTAAATQAGVQDTQLTQAQLQKGALLHKSDVPEPELFARGMYGPMLVPAAAAGSGAVAVRRSRAASLESRNSGGGDTSQPISRASSPGLDLAGSHVLLPSGSVPAFPGSARARLQGAAKHAPALQAHFFGSNSPSAPVGPNVRSPVKLPAPESITTQRRGGGSTRTGGGIEAFRTLQAPRPRPITTSLAARGSSGALLDVWQHPAKQGGGISITPVQRVSVGQQRQRVSRGKAREVGQGHGTAAALPSSSLQVSGSQVQGGGHGPATVSLGGGIASVQGRQRVATSKPTVMSVHAHGLR